MTPPDGDYLRFLISNKLFFYPPYVPSHGRRHIDALSGTVGAAASLPRRNEHAAAGGGRIGASRCDVSHELEPRLIRGAAAPASSRRCEPRGDGDSSVSAELLRVAMIRSWLIAPAAPPADSSRFASPPVTTGAQQQLSAEEAWPRKRTRESEPAAPAEQPAAEQAAEEQPAAEAPCKSYKVEQSYKVSRLGVTARSAAAPLIPEPPQLPCNTITSNSNRTGPHSTGLLPQAPRTWSQHGKAEAQLSGERDLQCRSPVEGLTLHGPWVGTSSAGTTSPTIALAEVPAAQSAASGKPEGFTPRAEALAAACSWDGRLLGESSQGVGGAAGERSGGSGESGGTAGRAETDAATTPPLSSPFESTHSLSFLPANPHHAVTPYPSSSAPDHSTAAASVARNPGSGRGLEASFEAPQNASLARNPGSGRSPACGSVDLSLRLGLSQEAEEKEAEEKEAKEKEAKEKEAKEKKAAGGDDEGGAGGADEQRGVSSWGLLSMPGHQWYAPYGGCTSCDARSHKSAFAALSDPVCCLKAVGPVEPGFSAPVRAHGVETSQEPGFRASSFEAPQSHVACLMAVGPVEPSFRAPVEPSFSAPVEPSFSGPGLESHHKPSFRARVHARGMQRRSSPFTLPAVPEGYALPHGRTWACEFANAAATAVAAATAAAAAAAPAAPAAPSRAAAGACVEVSGGYAMARDSIWECESAAPAAAAAVAGTAGSGAGLTESISPSESRGRSVYDDHALLYQINLERHMRGKGRMGGEGERAEASLWDWAV
ncbi:unnamed protein product [Closterium sp. NIES-65]|nr:unnamed protein product [Closterium sp. NIES-65]